MKFIPIRNEEGRVICEANLSTKIKCYRRLGISLQHKTVNRDFTLISRDNHFVAIRCPSSDEKFFIIRENLLSLNKGTNKNQCK